MNTVQICKTLLEIGLSLMIQSGVIMGVALAAAKWLGRRGAAFQALILRSAIVAVLLCALLSLSFAGRIHPLISLSLPSPQEQTASSVSPPVFADTSRLARNEAISGVSAATPISKETVNRTFNNPSLQYPSNAPLVEQATPVPHPVSAPVFRLAWIYVSGAILWLTVALGLLIWLIACQIHLFFLALRSERVASGAVWEALQAHSPEVSLRPRLLASNAVKSPFLAGLWRPAIFLPTDFNERFAPDAIMLVIAHEMCHLRRRDGIWTLLIRLTRSLLWVQPLSWLLERRLLDSFEAICDAEVIGQGKVSASRYADCLVGMAEHLAMPPAARAVGLGVAPFRSSLGKRVQNILSGARSFVQPITPALRMGIAVAAATLALAGVMLVSERIPSRAASAQTPTSVVQAYLDDLSNGQNQQANELFSPATKSEISFDFFPRNIDLYSQAATITPHDASLYAANALFHAHGVTAYRYEVVGPSVSDPNAVRLRVYPPGITLRNSFILDVVTVPDPEEGNAPRIDIDKTLALIDPNAPQEMAARATADECAAHLKQLSLAAIEYAQDNNLRFPDASRWADEIRPYMKDKTAFQDPFDPKVAWCFAFNRNLSHVKIAQLESPSQTVLFFESTANKKNASDIGQSLAKLSGLNGSLFAFADGHVKLIQNTVHPSFSLTPDRVSAAIEKYRVYLYSAPPGQNQEISVQFVDPNVKYQKGTSYDFNPRPGTPYLGIQYAPASNFKGSPVISHLPADVVKSGMVVLRVVPGGPAATAGIQKDDIIFEADGKSLDGNPTRLRTIMARRRAGERMELTVYSHGQTRTVTVVVGKAPAIKKQASASVPQNAFIDRQLALKRTSFAVYSQIQEVRLHLLRVTEDLEAEKHSPKREKVLRPEVEVLEEQLKALEAELVALNRTQQNGPKVYPLPKVPGMMPEIWPSR